MQKLISVLLRLPPVTHGYNYRLITQEVIRQTDMTVSLAKISFVSSRGRIVCSHIVGVDSSGVLRAISTN